MLFTKDAKKPEPTPTPQPVRIIEFRNTLGKFCMTFPAGHTFAEDEEKIFASYETDSVTIHKARVWDLRVKATYPREPKSVDGEE